MSEEKEESVFETEPEEKKAEEEVKEEPKQEEKKEEAESKEEENTVPFADGIDHSSEKQWYVANTYSGRERIVADYLEKRKVSMHMENFIFRIVVAEQEEDVIDKKTNKPMVKKNGEKKTKIINLCPGYIFVEAIMSDLAWYVIRNTPGVTGLVGSSGSGTKPFPVPREEMIPILKKMNLIVSEVRGDFAVNDKVKITDGAFADDEGVITSVDITNALATVTVTFFGRPTSVQVAFASLEKVD